MSGLGVRGLRLARGVLRTITWGKRLSFPSSATSLEVSLLVIFSTFFSYILCLTVPRCALPGNMFIANPLLPYATNEFSSSYAPILSQSPWQYPLYQRLSIPLKSLHTTVGFPTLRAILPGIESAANSDSSFPYLAFSASTAVF